MRIIAICALCMISAGLMAAQQAEPPAPSAPVTKQQTTPPPPDPNAKQILVWLNEAQKKALVELLSGYAESILCGKEVDFPVAAAFLKSRLGQDTFTPEQLAEIAHLAAGIQRAQMDRIAKQRLSRKVIEERCKNVATDAFGPGGKLIPGLLQ